MTGGEPIQVELYPNIPSPVQQPKKFYIKEPINADYSDEKGNVWENRMVNLDNCKYIEFNTDDNSDNYISFIFSNNYNIKQLFDSPSNVLEELSVLLLCKTPCDCDNGDGEEGSGSGEYPPA